MNHEAATCPICGHEGCKVRDQYRQATRTEPMVWLGAFGYCPECQVSFTPREETSDAVV